MRSNLLGWVVALVGVSAVGCASAETVPVAVTVTTSAQAAGPAKKEAAVDPLKRDADLGGNEHKVSLLEGRLTAKLHAVETPKIATSSSPTKGILYTTIDAKLGDEQTAHCAAYGDQLWPGGLAAGDLRGEHDWANDESEKSDAVAKTTTELTQTDVVVMGSRPVITARGTVRDESSQIVADRKVVVLQGNTFTLLCSDRTLGFDKRFHAFVNELIGSLKPEVPANITPRRIAIYKTISEGKTVGYYQVMSFVEPKGAVRTYSAEVVVLGANGKVGGVDAVTTSTANARGEENDIHVQGVLDNVTIQSLGATRDAKGWNIHTGIGGVDVATKRLPAKTSIMTQLSPGWLARMQGVASKKVPSAKLPLLDHRAQGPVISVAKRQADGSVSYLEGGKEVKATLDAEGLATLQNSEARYERIFVEGTK